jgi:hypothetical protein
MQTSWLRKSFVVSIVALGAAVIGQTASADPADVIRWESVIGIALGGNIVGVGMGQATGAPGPWTAQGGRVRVDLDTGQIDFSTNGLVLANGKSIGTRGAVAQVKGTLVCDTDGSASGGSSVLVDTSLVELDEQGDAHFSGKVTLPAVCANEPDIAFLIRTASGLWIGNGTVLR